MSFRSILQLLVAVTLGLFQLAMAESVKIHNLSFAVDSIDSSRNSVIELTIFGEKELIPSQARDSRIVAKYWERLDDPSLIEARISPFPVNQIQQFIQLSASAKDYRIAGLGLGALVMHPQSSLELVDETLWGLDLKAAQFATNIALDSLSGIRTTLGTEMPLLALAAYFRPGSLDPNDLRYSGNSKPEFIRYLSKRYIQSLMEGREQLASKMLTGYSFLFKSEPSYLKKLIQLGSVIPPILKGFREGKDISVLTLRDISRGDERIRAILDPAYTNFINSTAQRNIEEKKYGYALWLLSKISFETRTPSTHDLTLTILQNLKGQDRSPVLRTGVSSFLGKMSSHDERIANEYKRLLYEQMRFILQQNEPQRFNIFFGLLLAINPDPSELNDRLRVARADHYLQKGEIGTGLVLLKSLRGSLPTSEQMWINFRILWLEYTVLIYVAGFVFLVSLVTFVVRLFSTLKSLSKLSGTRSDPEPLIDEELFEKQQEYVSHADDEDIPLFVKGGSATQLTPIAHEYMSLLHIFDLLPGATLQDVKRVYRDEMKRLHPDMGSGISHTEDTEAIMRYKAAYNRIIEIEREGLISEDEKQSLKRRSEILHSW